MKQRTVNTASRHFYPGWFIGYDSCQLTGTAMDGVCELQGILKMGEC